MLRFAEETMTQTLDDIQQLAHEHQVLLRGYGHAQLRSSELLCLQAQEIERLQRLVIRQRAALMAKETRSEEHTSELQSQSNLVCRLLLEKKKKKNKPTKPETL